MKIIMCIFRNFKKILLSLATLTLISKAEILPELSGVNAINTNEHTKDYYKISFMTDVCSENHCHNGGAYVHGPMEVFCVRKVKSVALYLAIAAGIEAIIILALLTAVIFLCCRIKKIVKKNSSIPIILRQTPVAGAEDIPNLYSDEFSKRYSLPSELQIPRPQVVQS
ncbi:hypothetical protein T03_17393 [Trichinella britovi]|uniref:Uncharacterized protein n=1 Tax=Trichinella britovi TaxID=45882 RepID=A0A0V1DFU1_TRIBR|nr:hypothetical protein T03_17393 [Trichinella britovi]